MIATARCPHVMCSALLLAAAYAVAGSSIAPAPSDAVAFDWTAPAQCPSSANVRTEVERQLGSPLSALELSPWSVVARVSRDHEGGFSLALTIETPDGRSERTLHDPNDCAALSDAAALLVALALDPEAVTGKGEPVSAGATEPEPEPAPKSAATQTEPEPDLTVEPASPPPRRERPLDFVLGVAGGFDWGTLHGVSPIGKAIFAWQLPRMRAGVSATFGVAPGFAVPSVNRDVSLWMWTVGAEAGPVFRVRSFEFPLMAGLEAGQITIRPRVLLDPSRQQVIWAALLVTPGVAWVPRPWVAIGLNFGLVVSFVRPEFAIQGIGQIAAPQPVGLRANLGVDFRFPLSVRDRG